MNRTLLLSLLAALTSLTVACERHPATELAGEHGAPAAGNPEHQAEAAHPAAGPMHAPEAVPANPGGAAPAAGKGTEPAATHGAAPAATPSAAPQYFPGNK